MTPGDSANLDAFSGPVPTRLGIFIPAASLVVVYRCRTTWSLHLMCPATMSPMPSPIGRIRIHYLGVPLEAAGRIVESSIAAMIMAISIRLAAVLPICGGFAHGKVERVRWIGFGIVFFAGALIGVLVNDEGWAGLMAGPSPWSEVEPGPGPRPDDVAPSAARRSGYPASD